MTILATNPYAPTWESLKDYTVPAWFKDAKLGIFIHWGVYSVPAFENEWYPRLMYLDEVHVRKRVNFFRHHVETYGPHAEFGYKDFIPDFRAENWDPAAWVDLFSRAGARYVVPVAEHHDGFPMYDCPFTNWNAAQMGPRRDTVAELEGAVRAAGLRFGVSSHRAFNWRYYTFREAFDSVHPDAHKLYGVPHTDDAPVSYEFILDWYARTRDLVDRFSPDVLWFDFGWHRDEFEPWRPRVAAYYYNHAQENGYEPVLQYKDGFPDGTAVLDIERGKLDHLRDEYWQTDTSVSYKSWSFIENDEFRTVTSIVHDMVDIVSKNGNLLLNIGPRPDGTIPEQVEEILLGLGEWLEINGEAIYGTRPWRTFGEGPTEVSTAQFAERDDKPFTAEDVRFTRKDGVLYAICLGWPEEPLTIRSLAASAELAVATVALLGSDEPLTWSQDAEGLKIAAPRTRPGDHACAYRIALREAM